MTRTGVGQFQYTYVVPASSPLGQQVIFFDYDESSVAKQQVRTLQMVEISGEVAQILSEARQTEIAISSGAAEDAFRFRALKAQYEANAPLMLTQQWTLAMSDFLDKEFVQTFMVPEGSSDMIELRLNPDPDITKQLDVARKRLEAEAAAEERERIRKQDRYNTDRGVIRGDSVN